jgi:hypothetical protein
MSAKTSDQTYNHGGRPDKPGRTAVSARSRGGNSGVEPRSGRSAEVGASWRQTIIGGRGRGRRVAVALTVAFVLSVPLAFIEETIVAVDRQASAAISNGSQLMGEYAPIGNFVETTTGLRVYCIDSSADWPAGQTISGSGTLVSSLDSRDWAGSPAALNGNDIGQMNYIVSTWGQTADAVQAAAVNVALFAFTKGSVSRAKTYIGYADGNAATVSILVDQFLAEAASVVNGAGSAGSGQLIFDVDGTDNHHGNLAVSLSPTSATGTVTLTNGIFSDTGTNTISGVANGVVLAVNGVAPDDDPLYKISANGTFSAGSWANSIYLSDFGANGQQRMVTGAGLTPTQFSVAGIDPNFRSAVFQPAGSTAVPLGVIAQGEQLGDVLQPMTVADVAGLNNPWKQFADGVYYPVTYRATAYLVPPADYPADPAGVYDIPATAVEVASTRVTTGDLGPTTTYPYSLGEAPGPGMFVIVVGVEFSDQTAGLQMFIPDDYSWRDNFGQYAESILIPAVTTKAKPDYLPGETVWDDVIVSGIWPAAEISDSGSS